MLWAHLQVAAAYVCVCCCLALLLHLPIRRLRACHKRKGPWKFRCPSRWFSRPEASTEDDILSRTNTLALVRQLERWLFFCQSFPFIVIVPLGVSVCNHVLSGFDSELAVATGRYILPYAFVGIVGVLSHIFPRMVMGNWYVAPLTLSLMHLACMKVVMESADLLQFLNTSIAIAAVRVGQATLFTNLPFQFCAQVTWVLVNSSTWWVMMEQDGTELLCHTGGVATTAGLLEASACMVRDMVVKEGLVTAVTLVVATIVESATYAEARATVEGKVIRQFDSTVQSLLKALCDAVVYLDADLRVNSNSPTAQLTALLLRQGPEPLLGRHICDFVVEEDREALREQLESHCSSTAPATSTKSIAVSLGDSSTGSRLKAQVLHTHFLDLDDKPQHCLAIRELDMEELPASVHDNSNCGFIVIDIVEYTIIRTEPSSMATGYQAARGQDFRKCLRDPSLFERHVRQFCADSCLDVFEVPSVSSEPHDENEVGGSEITLQRSVGLHSLRKNDRQSRTRFEWTAHLTLETSPGMFFSSGTPMIKVHVAKMTPLSLLTRSSGSSDGSDSSTNSVCSDGTQDHSPPDLFGEPGEAVSSTSGVLELQAGQCLAGTMPTDSRPLSL